MILNVTVGLEHAYMSHQHVLFGFDHTILFVQFLWYFTPNTHIDIFMFLFNFK